MLNIKEDPDLRAWGICPCEADAIGFGSEIARKALAVLVKANKVKILYKLGDAIKKCQNIIIIGGKVEIHRQRTTTVADKGVSAGIANRFEVIGLKR